MSVLLTKKTKLRQLNKTSLTLLTSVPTDIVQILEVTDNDKLEWVVELVNGEIEIKIRKIEETEE